LMGSGRPALHLKLSNNRRAHELRDVSRDTKLASKREAGSGGIVMEKDVVCGMQVDPAKAAATSEYQGKTYYFCARACKVKFDANPAQYVK
jgi:YHS domain-containing protein